MNMNHFGVPPIGRMPQMIHPGMPPPFMGGFRPMMGMPPIMQQMNQPPLQGIPYKNNYKPITTPITTVIQAPPALTSTPNVVLSTVYVGKIPLGVEDDFVKKMLDQCGKNIWRRVNDPVSGKPKGFGFCDFELPEGALRALKGLNGLKIDNGELLLKVDEKTQKLIDEYSAKKAKAKENGAEKPDQDEERTRDAIKQLMYKRDKGEDYKNFEYDPTKARIDEKREKKEKEDTEEERIEREKRKQTEREREKGKKN